MKQHDRLLALADHYQQKADALRLAAAELNGHLTTAAQATLPAKLAKAIKTRTAARVADEPRKRTGGMSTAAKIRRRDTAARLNAIEKAGGVGKGQLGHRAAVLLQHGYIRKDERGMYVRTDKPFVP